MIQNPVINYRILSCSVNNNQKNGIEEIKNYESQTFFKSKEKLKEIQIILYLNEPQQISQINIGNYFTPVMDLTFQLKNDNNQVLNEYKYGEYNMIMKKEDIEFFSNFQKCTQTFNLELKNNINMLKKNWNFIQIKLINPYHDEDVLVQMGLKFFILYGFTQYEILTQQNNELLKFKNQLENDKDINQDSNKIDIELEIDYLKSNQNQIQTQKPKFTNPLLGRPKNQHQVDEYQQQKSPINNHNVNNNRISFFKQKNKELQQQIQDKQNGNKLFPTTISNLIQKPQRFQPQIPQASILFAKNKNVTGASTGLPTNHSSNKRTLQQKLDIIKNKNNQQQKLNLQNKFQGQNSNNKKRSSSHDSQKSQNLSQESQKRNSQLQFQPARNNSFDKQNTLFKNLSQEIDQHRTVQNNTLSQKGFLNEQQQIIDNKINTENQAQNQKLEQKPKIQGKSFNFKRKQQLDTSDNFEPKLQPNTNYDLQKNNLKNQQKIDSLFINKNQDNQIFQSPSKKIYKNELDQIISIDSESIRTNQFNNQNYQQKMDIEQDNIQNNKNQQQKQDIIKQNSDNDSQKYNQVYNENNFNDIQNNSNNYGITIKTPNFDYDKQYQEDMDQALKESLLQFKKEQEMKEKLRQQILEKEKSEEKNKLFHHQDLDFSNIQNTNLLQIPKAINQVETSDISHATTSSNFQQQLEAGLQEMDSKLEATEILDSNIQYSTVNTIEKEIKDDCSHISFNSNLKELIESNKKLQEELDEQNYNDQNLQNNQLNQTYEIGESEIQTENQNQSFDNYQKISNLNQIQAFQYDQNNQSNQFQSNSSFNQQQSPYLKKIESQSTQIPNVFKSDTSNNQSNNMFKQNFENTYNNNSLSISQNQKETKKSFYNPFQVKMQNSLLQSHNITTNNNQETFDLFSQENRNNSLFQNKNQIENDQISQNFDQKQSQLKKPLKSTLNAQNQFRLCVSQLLNLPHKNKNLNYKIKNYKQKNFEQVKFFLQNEMFQIDKEQISDQYKELVKKLEKQLQIPDDKQTYPQSYNHILTGQKFAIVGINPTEKKQIIDLGNQLGAKYTPDQNDNQLSYLITSNYTKVFYKKLLQQVQENNKNNNQFVIISKQYFEACKLKGEKIKSLCDFIISI